VLEGVLLAFLIQLVMLLSTLQFAVKKIKNILQFVFSYVCPFSISITKLILSQTKMFFFLLSNSYDGLTV